MSESLDELQKDLQALQADLRETVRQRQDIEQATPLASALRAAIRQARRDRDSLVGPQVQQFRQRNAKLTEDLNRLWADMDHIRWMLKRLDRAGGRVLDRLPPHAKETLKRLLDALNQEDAELRSQISQTLLRDGIEEYPIPAAVRIELAGGDL